MKHFEIIGNGGTEYAHTVVADCQIPVYCLLFGVDSLEGLWDIAPAASAIPIIDAGIQLLNTGSYLVRAAISAEDTLNMRGYRIALEAMRRNLEDMRGSTISGLVEDVVPSSP